MAKVKRDAFLYEEPRPPVDKFAQCATCVFFTNPGCPAIGDKAVKATDSCGLYCHGKPGSEKPKKPFATPEEAGLVHRAVRCENCSFFEGPNHCGLFARLNKEQPDIFDLDEKVHPKACCNSQMPKTAERASGGRIALAPGGTAMSDEDVWGAAAKGVLSDDDIWGKPKPPAAKPEEGGYAWELGKGVLRGAAKTLPEAAAGIGQTASDVSGYFGGPQVDLGLTDKARQLSQAAQDKLAPNPNYPVTGQVGETLGGVGVYGAELAGGPVGWGAAAATAAGQGAEAGYQMAQQHGATQGQRVAAELGMGGAQTALLAIPGIGEMINKLPMAARSGILGYAARTVYAGGAGASIGAVQSAVNDAIEKYTVNPDKVVGDGMASQGLVLGLASALYHGTVGEATRAKPPEETRAPWQKPTVTEQAVDPASARVGYGLIDAGERAKAEAESGSPTRGLPAPQRWNVPSLGGSLSGAEFDRWIDQNATDADPQLKTVWDAAKAGTIDPYQARGRVADILNEREAKLYGEPERTGLWRRLNPRADINVTQPSATRPQATERAALPTDIRLPDEMPLSERVTPEQMKNWRKMGYDDESIQTVAKDIVPYLRRRLQEMGFNDAEIDKYTLKQARDLLQSGEAGPRSAAPPHPQVAPAPAGVPNLPEESGAPRLAGATEPQPTPTPPNAAGAREEVGSPYVMSPKLRGTLQARGFTPEQIQKMTPAQGMSALRDQVRPEANAATAELNAELRRYGVADKVGARVVDNLTDPEGNEVGAQVWNDLIKIAQADPRTMRGYLGHEVIGHLYRNFGLYTPQEWNIISRWADRTGRKQYDIDRDYAGDAQRIARAGRPEDVQELLRQEAWARHVEGVLSGETKEPNSRIAKLIARIGNFFEAMRNWMRGDGFQSLAGVMNRAMAGEPGTRPADPRAIPGLAAINAPQMARERAKTPEEQERDRRLEQERREAALQKYASDKAGLANADRFGRQGMVGETHVARTASRPDVAPEQRPDTSRPVEADGYTPRDVIGGGEPLFARKFASRAPVFYSALEKGVQEGPEKAKPEDWRGYLANKQGVKKDEMDWTGVHDWLAQQKGSVSRDDLLQHIRDHQVELQEVHYDNAGKAKAARALEKARNRLVNTLQDHVPHDAMDNEMMTPSGMVIRPEHVPEGIMDHWIEPKDLPLDAQQAARDFLVTWGAYRDHEIGGPRYEKYTLPGGKNQHEMLLTMGDNGNALKNIRAAYEQHANTPDDMRDAAWHTKHSELWNRFEDARRARNGAQFTGAHYNDVPNILAHVRMNDRKDADGKRVLHLEEMQSDWHQQGRKYGYVAPGVRVQDGRVPDAPFKSSWHELAMKRMLRYAAENGYDRLTWTTGDQQLARYPIERVIDKIHYIKNPDGTHDLVLSPKAGASKNYHDLSDVKLDGLIGKELADKIRNGAGEQQPPIVGRPWTTMSGDNIKVGGKGMRGFYDKMLPDFVNKYTKKWGARVGKAEINTPLDGTVQDYSPEEIPELLKQPRRESVHAVDITPEMRQSVMQGQPLFARKHQRIEKERDEAYPQAVRDRLNAIVGPVDHRPWYQRLTDGVDRSTFSKLYQKTVDFAHAAKLNERALVQAGQIAGNRLSHAGEVLASYSAHKAMIFAGRANSYLSEIFSNKGIPVAIKDADGTVLGTRVMRPQNIPGLRDVLAPLVPKNLFREFQAVMAVERGQRLLAEGRENVIRPDDVQWAQQMMAEHPEIGQAREMWHRFHEGMLDYAADTGIVEPAKAAEWKANGDYISFYRELPDGDLRGPGGMQGFVGLNPIKKLQGGTEHLGDFLENTNRWIQALMKAGLKNVAAQRALRDAEALGVANRIPVRLPRDRQAVEVKVGGKSEYWHLDDPLLYEALHAMDGDTLGVLNKIFRVPAGVLRTAVTRNPVFAYFRHPFRESLQNAIVSPNTMIPIIDTLRGSANVMRHAPSAEQMKSLGVGGGFDYGGGSSEHAAAALRAQMLPMGRNMSVAENASAFMHKFWHRWEKAFEASDLGTRDAVFRKEMGIHGDEFEAAYQSLNQAINFNRHGSSPFIRAMTGAIPFLNARIQGLDLLGRAMKERPGQTFTRLGILAGLTAAYYSYVRNDPLYRQAPDYVKDSNFIIPDGLGHALLLPIPFEAGILGKNMPERLFRAFTGDDMPVDTQKAVTRALFDTLKMEPLPQAVLPAVEAATNYSTFQGRPLIPRSLEGLEGTPQYQYTDRTSETAKFLGGLPIYPDPRTGTIGPASPIKVDHIINGYFGALGGYLTAIIDAGMSSGKTGPAKPAGKVTDMPMLGQILKDSHNMGVDDVDRVYELKERADSLFSAVKKLRTDGDTEAAQKLFNESKSTLAMRPRLEQMAKGLSQIRKAQVAITKSRTISPEEKTRRLDELRDRQQQIASRIETLRQRALQQ